MNEIVISIIAIVISGVSLWVSVSIKKSVENKYETRFEKFKNELERKNSIYDKQFNAYKTFTKIMHQMFPKKTYPDMCWEEALEDIAISYEMYYKSIREFLSDHSLILPKQIKTKIEECLSLCENGQFEIQWDNKHAQITDEGLEMTKKLLGNLKMIEEDFRTVLKIDQVG